MTLLQLFSVFRQFELGAAPDKMVAQLTLDSRKVTADSVYIAIRGSKVDSHSFLRDVCKKNPLGVVVESRENIPADYRGGILQVDSTRAALMTLASHFYQNPSEKLLCMGVTGTNGKTSTSLMLEKILGDNGCPAGVMGTIDHHFGARVWPTDLTTPDAITLQQRLREFLDLGAKGFVAEVSSHALSQFRADSVQWDVALFTNLTRDHLDYHSTMDEYFHAKERLFHEVLQQSKKAHTLAVVNTDDPWGARLKISTRARLLTFGQNGQDFSFHVTRQDFAGTNFALKSSAGSLNMTLPLVGLHNVYNAVGAIAACVGVGIPLAHCAQSLGTFSGVPGRLERVPNARGLHVFVDYAHTPDALEKVLQALNAVRQQSKIKNQIWTVFGCGGDRDKGKRPVMLQTALQHSDQVVLTSDNPRTEDPQSIVDDCLRGLTTQVEPRLHVNVDRREAIHLALSRAQTGDAIVIAGKGHEDYQIIGQQKFPFSDVLVAKEFLR